MATMRRRIRIAAVAVLSAAAIWLAYGWVVLFASNAVAAKDIPWLLGIVAVGVALDLGIAALVLRESAPRPVAIGYLGLRSLMSASGFLILTLPSYLVALVAIGLPTARVPIEDPDEPHTFVAQYGGWFRGLTPISWSRNLMGASQYGANLCAVCGQPADDQRHAIDADEALEPILSTER
jgi:hypothetical protein